MSLRDLCLCREVSLQAGCSGGTLSCLLGWHSKLAARVAFQADCSGGARVSLQVGCSGGTLSWLLGWRSKLIARVALQAGCSGGTPSCLLGWHSKLAVRVALQADCSGGTPSWLFGWHSKLSARVSLQAVCSGGTLSCLLGCRSKLAARVVLQAGCSGMTSSLHADISSGDDTAFPLRRSNEAQRLRFALVFVLRLFAAVAGLLKEVQGPQTPAVWSLRWWPVCELCLSRLSAAVCVFSVSVDSATSISVRYTVELPWMIRL